MKKILVLARDDVDEAMRVAAGLTIFGHQVDCVVVAKGADIQPDNEQLELLELADIQPRQLQRSNDVEADTAGTGVLPAIGRADLSQLFLDVDATMSF